MVLVVSSVQKLSLIEGTSKQGIVSKFSFYYSWVPNKRPPPPRLLMFELRSQYKNSNIKISVIKYQRKIWKTWNKTYILVVWYIKDTYC